MFARHRAAARTPAEAARLALLEHHYPVLTQLPSATRTRILAESVEMQLPAGATVFDERQACEGFPLVLEGEIRVLKAAPNGRELPLYRVSAGETCVISSACLLGASAYNARGITTGPCRLLLLPRPLFEQLLDAPPFRSFVFRLIAERLADLMQLIEEVAFRRLDQRLAALLLATPSPLHVTHQQLADELGSVREIVSRLLKGFAAQELVRLGREQIEVLDPGRLRALAADR